MFKVNGMVRIGWNGITYFSIATYSIRNEAIVIDRCLGDLSSSMNLNVSKRNICNFINIKMFVFFSKY